jgi:hypothetical protein
VLFVIVGGVLTGDEMIRTTFWTALICLSIVAGVAFTMLFDVLLP